MKSSVSTNLLRNAAAQTNLATLANNYGVFTGGTPASGIAQGWEIITQPIRDYQTYPAAGFRSRSFFQQAAGSTGTNPADQNMPAAGSFPRGQMFLWEGIEVDFQPSGEPVTSGATVDTRINEFAAVMQGGYLTVTIGSRPYLNVGNLLQFPTSFRAAADAAMGVSSDSDATTATLYSTNLPYAEGEVFQFIPYLLEEVVNFNVTVHYDTPVTVASDGKMGVLMNGCLIRRNQ